MRFTSTTTGSGKLRALAATVIISPASMSTDSPKRPLSEMRTVPSRTMIFTTPGLPGLYSIISVVPVIAAVMGALRIVAPPASLGTWSKIAPFSKSSMRVPRSKLKSVLAPRRARVASGNVSWARELAPVRMPVWPRTVSPSEAGMGCAPGGMSSTEFTILVTVAWLSWAAARGDAAAIRTAAVARRIFMALRI